MRPTAIIDRVLGAIRFTAEQYARLPKPLRYVLHPFLVMIFIVLALPSLIVARGCELVYKSYRDFDDSRL